MMSIELEQRLKEEFPFIRPWYGIQCGDGWFGLLHALCCRIKKFLEKEKIENFQVVQIKEKFGTLRFYTSPSFDKIEEFIQDAEDVSAVTCEYCGQPGKIRGDKWIRVLCDQCKYGE